MKWMALPCSFGRQHKGAPSGVSGAGAGSDRCMTDRDASEPTNHMIRIKRVYSEPSLRDGIRILVDRVWPRGVTRKRAHIDAWRKELAPSTPLRKWFGHDPARWIEFRKRYRRELADSHQTSALKELARLSRHRTITLLYGAADEEHNQALFLKEMLDKLR